MTLAITDLTPCVYCGAVATSVDHVPPRSIRSVLQQQDPLQKRWPFREVAACLECNMLLGAQACWTVSARKKFIKQKLRHRYAKILKMPDWEDSELGQMSHNMQMFILESLRKREFIQARIRY